MAGTLGGPDVDMLVSLTKSDAKLNYIDDPSNLKNDKVFVYSGKVNHSTGAKNSVSSWNQILVICYCRIIFYLYSLFHISTLNW
jgi:hypothetical protein